MRLLKFVILLLLPAATLTAQDWAKPRLENSPRHLEWVSVNYGTSDGAREVKSLIAFPEVKEKVTAVVVIHEIFGLTDWAQGVTDQLAEAGYIAIAPDLLSGMGPNGGGTDSFEGGSARRAVSSLPDDQVTSDLEATVEYVRKLPACNGKVVVAGFCWGGRQTFRFATNTAEKLEAACPFYGSGPDSAEAIARIKCPVYGFYGENDARVNSTIEKSKELMKAAGKAYQPVIYDGAGHGFMRAGEDPGGSPENKKAREDARKRWLAILAKTQ